MTFGSPYSASQDETATYTSAGIYTAEYTPSREGTYSVTVAMSNPLTAEYPYTTTNVEMDFSVDVSPTDPEACAHVADQIADETEAVNNRIDKINKTFLDKFYADATDDFNMSSKNPTRVRDILESEMIEEI